MPAAWLEDHIVAVTLYVKTDCPYCAALRRELNTNAVEFTEINVEERSEVVPEVLKLTGGRRIVPVLVDGSEVSIAPYGG